MSFGPALALGMEGHDEVLEFRSRSIFSPEEFLERINSRLPEGVRAHSLQCLESDAPTLSESLVSMTFSLKLEDDRIVGALSSLQGDAAYDGLTERAVLERRVAEYMTGSGNENSARLELEQDRLRLLIPIGPGKNPRPQDIVERLLRLPNPAFYLTREGMTLNEGA